MKNHRKFLLLLIGICLMFLLLFIVQIYAKYLTSTDGNANLTIAKWNILVNNLSIKENTDLSNSIVPVFPGNEHIAKDIIAPTAEGYFDLNLDFTNADVSFKYEISTIVSPDSFVQDLVATGYSIDDGQIIPFTDGNTLISEEIPLTSQNKNKKIRVFIEWNDDETTQTMTNEQDTISTMPDHPAILNVNVSFTQTISNTPANP